MVGDNLEKAHFIEKTMSSLMKRLESNNNLLILQLEEGYITEATCTFNEPASDKDINDFSKLIGQELPDDYIQFLKITNGCRLFDHPKYGGENYIYSLKEMMPNTYEELDKRYLKIGYFYQESLFIDFKLHISGTGNYLFVKDSIEQFSKGRALNMNFELWFDRFVINQGAKFWNYSK